MPDVITEDQTEVIAYLSSPATYGGAPVQRLETHSSLVFLAGERALKLKRAVRYDYLDFSTADRRRRLSEAEVRVNRRTAPEIYRGVLPVTREHDGSLALDGSGAPVDWVVDMHRFPQEQLFDRLAARGALPRDRMPALAAAISRFHAEAERTPEHGGRGGLATVIDGNAAGFHTVGRGILDPAVCRAVILEGLAALEKAGPLLDRRRDAGFVRRCHGDLHLRNIVLLDGQPTLFDGIEFNDELSCIDVFYDVAFLLMDLWHRGLPEHANVVFNGYVSSPADLEALVLLPLFLSTRAAVRAKTSATTATLQPDLEKRRPLERLASRYLEMSRDLLQAPGASLVAIGGLSGTGKSTLARALAPRVGAVPGALVVRSDEVRKRLHAVPPLVRLGPEAYAADVSRRVYQTLDEWAGTALAAGHSVVVDAVFLREDERASIEQVAVARRVPFTGLWLEAPERALMERVAKRQRDASDADVNVVRQQLALTPGTIGWRRLDAGGAHDALAHQALAAIGEPRPRE